MSYSLEEINVALASIDDVDRRNSAELEVALEVMEIVNNNNSIGITMDEGKRLVELGITIDLDELSQNRIHVGNEAMLTDTGKTGLYGLAIGALIVVIAFIIKKVFGWFKDSDSSSSSSSKSKTKELEKSCPSMSSNPSTMVKLPQVLLHDSDTKDFLAHMEDFCKYCDDTIKAATDENLEGKAIPDAILKKYIDSLKAELKRMKYDAKGETFEELIKEVKDSDPRDLPYGKIKTAEIFVADIAIEVDDKMVATYNATKDKLEKFKNKKSDSAASLMLVRDLSKVMSAVMTKNFVKVMGIIKAYNVYLDALKTAYGRAFEEQTVLTLSQKDELKTFFANAKFDDHRNLSAIYDKIIKAGKDKGYPAISSHYASIAEKTKDFEAAINKQLGGEDSKDKKKD